MRLYLDFESRSACDLKKHGAWVYSEDPTTEVLCMSFKWEGHKARCLRDILHHGGSEEARALVGNLIKDASTIEAHNMAFEYAMWTNVCVTRYGWPLLPVEKLRCSAAKAAMHSLPRHLEGACQALGLRMQKDMEGHRLMLKMCKPRKPRKDEPEINPNDPRGYYWHEDPADFERLYEYCIRDGESEEGLSDALRDLPAQELAVWQLDQKINARGIRADIEGCNAMIAMTKAHEALLLKRLAKLTNGAVRTAKQIEQLKGYLRGLGVDLPDLAAATVKEALKGELNATAREILQIRSSLGRSSAGKYQAIIDRASADGRVRGTLLYHGAGTGRWSGAGIQPQNFPSRIKISANPENMLEAVRAGGIDLFGALYEDDPMSAAGAITRSVLMAEEGRGLVVADYSAIEGRVLAWLAGEETELDAYRKDLDPYIVSASTILHKPYGEITKDERNRIGKTSVLACGYGGSVGAVRKFGGEGMTDDEIKEQIVKPWREAHPMTVKFWYELEDACMAAVANPSRVTSARSIQFRVSGSFLMMRLPSGRLVYYYDPQILPCETSWGETKDCVTYMTVHSITKKWVRTNTYAGKLAENATQAVARDLMALAMLRVEEAGYPVVLSVHDELISEVPEGFGSVAEFERIMCELPPWAMDLPLKAAGWRGRRYRK